MYRRKLRAKRRFPKNSLHDQNIEDYLAQYKVTDIPNPSDDSDFEDSSYESDLKYEKEKEVSLQEKAEEKLYMDREREKKALLYYQKNKNNPNSIFKLCGVHFQIYNHKIIKFSFSPSAFSERYFCAHRKFRVSLVYSKCWWNLRRFDVPNKDDLTDIFEERHITDEDLEATILSIFKSFAEWIKNQKSFVKRRYQEFLDDQEIYLNSDEEKLFLSPESRRNRRRRINEIWLRMLPPSSSSNDD